MGEVDKIMDQLQHKIKVKVIALLDITNTCLSLAWAITRVLGAVAFTVKESEAESSNANTTNTSLLVWLWVMVTVEILAEILKIVAAVKLWKACQNDRDPKISHSLCKFWRNVNAGFVLLILIYLIFLRESSYQDVAIAIQAILYSVALYIVHLYMRELSTFEWIPNSQSMIMTDNNTEMNLPGNLDEEYEFNAIPQLNQQYSGGGSVSPLPNNANCH